MPDPYRSIKLPHLVRDALYNAHTDNFRHEMDVRYRTGVIVGVVSMVMAVNECNLADAIGAVRGHPGRPAAGSRSPLHPGLLAALADLTIVHPSDID